MPDQSTCPRCGAEVPEGARFCPACGLALGEAPREERRVVTVLFGDLSGFTEMSELLDAEEVKSIVDRAFEGLAELITLYGGRVDKIIGDEIMAVFGAPQSHEDDPERAVRCALDMERELTQYSRKVEEDRGVRLRMRIGVNTGEVVAGVVGDSYTVLGDTVNTASRIEHAAEPGQILVGEATYLATHQGIEYREHEPVVAKGKQDPLQVWEAVAERALPGEQGRRTTAPLVGRDEELALLESMAEIVRRDRRPSVVTVVGDAGMGKSRLAAEFARRLEAHGALVLAGRSLPYGTTSPSFAVEEMARAALGVGATQPEAARAQVAERLDRLGLSAEGERMLALLGLRERETAPVSGTRGASGPTAQAAPVGRGGEVLQSAARLFEVVAAREELTVLVFHELHWAEDSLLDFVAQVAERSRNAPLLVLCLSRPEVLGRPASWLGRAGSVVLSLEPLPREKAADLLDALLGAESIHPAVRENVLERAGGNPFYLEELVRLLLDQKAADARGRGTLSVPGSVHALVAARLDALEPEARRVVRDAAVVGDRFWTGALARLEPDLDAPRIASLLDVLAEKELVEPAESPQIPGQTEYRFRQTIAREVAYAGIPKQARARQHFAVGSWLEEVTCECQIEHDFFDLVAHHYDRAAALAGEVGVEVEGAGVKAREYLVRAGDQALGQDAAVAAAQFFERALPYATDERDLMHLRLHLGEALVGSWRPSEAERHLSEALADARRLGARADEGKALRSLGDLLRIRGDIPGARGHLEQALEIAKEVGDPREESEALRARGLVDMFDGKISAAVLWFRQALAHAREAGDARAQGWSLQNLAWAAMLLGRLDEALEELDEAAKVFGELQDLEGVGWSVGLRAWVLFFQGKLDEADGLQRQLEDVITSSLPVTAVSVGGAGLGYGHLLRAFVEVTRGHLSEAERLARSALEIFEDGELEWGRAMAHYPLVRIAILRRRLDVARAHLRTGAEATRRAGDPLLFALTRFLEGWTEFAAGNVDGAEALRVDARRLSAASGVQWIEEVGSAWLDASVLRARGRLAEARATLEVARGLTGSGIFPQSYALALLAEVLCDLGDATAAEKVARDAIDRAGDDRSARAISLRVLGRALEETGRATEAEAALREELDLLADSDWDEERVLALARLGAVLAAAGRADDAGDTLARARELLDGFPPDADVAALEDAFAKA